MNKIFEAVYKKHTEGVWTGLVTSTPQGAYDAVGNLVNAGDKVLWIKGYRKGSIQTVTAIKSSGYTGTQNIVASDNNWPRMYNIIKI